MTRKDRISSLFFILLSFYVCWQSVDLGLGRFRKPGPGFFSLFSGLVLGVLAITIFFKSWVLERHREEKGGEKIPWRPLTIAFGSLVSFVIFLRPLGFNWMAFLLIGIVLRFIEKRSWIVSGGVALGIALGAYLVFEVALQSRLPEGPIGFFGF